MTRAFYDCRCIKCGRKIGWCGTAAEMPPCPGCGFQGSMKDDQIVIDKFKALLTERSELTTREQKEAYDMGVSDFKPGISKLMDARSKNPYEGTCLEEYWRRGFIFALRNN